MKLYKSNEDNHEQKPNIEPILITLDVSKLDKFNENNDEFIEKYQFEPEILETEKNKLDARNRSKTLRSKKFLTKVASKFKNIPPKKNFW